MWIINYLKNRIKNRDAEPAYLLGYPHEYCPRCEAMLNIQPEFSEDCGMWSCTECGFVNKIKLSEIYVSDDEFKNDFNSPYKGLSDEDVLALSLYSEEGR